MTDQLFKKNYLTLAITLLLTSFLIVGCDGVANQLKTDRTGNYDVQDYRDAFAAREVPQEEYENDDGIPELQSYISPASEDLKPMRLISVYLDQGVPLRDALFELAKEVDYDIELDPRISGSVIFTARNRPFDVVVERIADIAGLRYKFEDNILRVELDTPYLETYKIAYLNMVRTIKSNLSADISVVTGDGATTGSGFKVSNEFEADFWKSLEEGIEQILDTAVKSSSMRTNADPEMSVSRSVSAPVAPLPASSLDDDGETVNSPNAVLNIQSLPVSISNAAANTDKANKVDYTPSFSINTHSGLISVFASEKIQNEISTYIEELRRIATAQVLIEAKILEVSLTDTYSAGIDWSALNKNQSTFSFDMFSRGSLSASTGGLELFFLKDDFGAAIDALSEFGTVKALASPRVTVINNQAAILNVARNVVFFEIDIDVTTDSGTSQTEVESTINTVPEGVLINVSPTINLDDNTILMAVRPTVTNIETFERDPGIEFVKATQGINDDSLVNEVPVVQVQEIDSIVKVNSGEIMVMGGLLQDRVTSTQSSVPVLGELPFVGKLFSSQTDSIKKSELVIFLKATIIKDTNIHNTDKELYKLFSHDRRPARF